MTNKTLFLSEIAQLIGGEVVGDPAKKIVGAAPFEHAREDEITFAAAPKFLKRLSGTRAGAVIVPKNFETSQGNVVKVKNPQVAFAAVVQTFYPPVPPASGIHPLSCIGESFVCGKDVSVSPFVCIGNRVTFGDRVTIGPNVVIGDGVIIGDDVKIQANVTILAGCRIGSRVNIHPGAVIGSDGFGFAPDKESYVKIPHIGIVQIDDDVEIGACNTIDRGTFGKTWIQRGVKTDNLVHIAHNVVVGENTLLVAQVGIAGSATIGKHAILAGQAGITGHIMIGDNATVGPQAGVGHSIQAGEIVSGSPEMPHRLWLRVQGIIPKLPELYKRILAIEKRLFGDELQNRNA